MRSSCSTARCVHTLQWPSRPPRMRTVTSVVAALHGEGRQQVEHDVVVVAGVQRDALFGAGRDHAAHHVERAVAVEGRHLDGDDVVDGGEAAPELRRQRDAADRGLQVEADQRHLRGHRRAMRDQFVDRRALHRRQRQHAGVVAQAARDVGLAHAPARWGRTGRRSAPPGAASSSRAVRAASSSTGSYRPTLADRELRGMHAHRQAAGAGVEVVARQRALAHAGRGGATRPAPAGAPG